MSKRIRFEISYIGYALRIARKRAKVSYEDLANNLGIPVQNLKRFERGRAKIPMETLTQLFLERLGDVRGNDVL